jgi:flagellar biosynthesis/type III secretory pathway protein FliH
MRKLFWIQEEATLSYSKVISFPEPPKAFTVGFVGDPPVPAGDAAKNSRIALEQGKSESTAFYQEEIRKLRSEYGQRQKDLLSATQAKVDGVLEELDKRLPDLVIGLAERVLGQTPLDRETVEAIVKNMVAEFSCDDEKLEVYLCADDLNLLKAFARDDEESVPTEGEGEESGFAGAIAGIFEGLDGDDALLEGYPNVSFHEDPTLSRGDCQIKSRFGLLDGRVATKLRKFETELKGE